jgi:hypothetical protein
MSDTEECVQRAKDIHECKRIRGKAQRVIRKHELMGDQGPLVWYLVAPTMDLPAIFAIKYCPFCGNRLNSATRLGGPEARQREENHEV